MVDRDHRVFGYQNLLICDGAVVPANPGVNPSLTITAMVERAMAAIPAKPGTPTTTPRARFDPLETETVSVFGSCSTSQRLKAWASATRGFCVATPWPRDSHCAR